MSRPGCTTVGLALLASGVSTAQGCDGSADDGLDGMGVVQEMFDPVDGICDAMDQGATDPFADCVESFDPAAEASFGHDALPSVVLGPPQGGGEAMGSTDVVSLGCGGSITVQFGEPWPQDGPGADLLVFENPFGAGDAAFVEPAKVWVSADGEIWRSFGCEPDGEPQPPGCAGLNPVHANGDADALAPETAGGDAFDLADVGLPHARYVRIEDLTEEHYGSRTWCMGTAGGFDLDAMAVVESSR